MLARSTFAAAFAVVCCLSACDEEEKLIVAPACAADSDCPAGQICEEAACIDASQLSCAAVSGGEPILQPDPAIIAFGQVGEDRLTRTIVLRNVGTCTLTVFEARLEKGAESPFVCAGCEEEAYPFELFPMRSQEVEISFQAPEVGVFEDHLLLLSDDAEFPEIRIPLRATFAGVPELRVLPSPLDFGFVSVGHQGAKKLSVSNAGTGTATLGITEVRLEPAEGSPFTLVTPFEAPRTLGPLSVDPSALLELELHYEPRAAESHAAELLLVTDAPTIGIVRVPLSGTAATPPSIEVTPTSVLLGEIPLGQVVTGHVTVQNQGGAPLEITPGWELPNSDLSVTPNVVPPIPPGGFVELSVLGAPTVEGPLSGLLVLHTNDPVRPSVAVPVSAEGRDVGLSVVKLELTYDNGDDSSFDDDLRNVDMALESPLGLLCAKQEPDPATWGDYGEPHWMSLGPKGEPERIVLINAQRNGTYRVLLSYFEDCTFMPSGLLAALLGVSVEVLAQYLSGGLIGGVGDDISSAIDEACLGHGETRATVTVSVDGAVVSETSVTLGRKGDYAYALDLVLEDGVFTVR